MVALNGSFFAAAVVSLDITATNYAFAAISNTLIALANNTDTNEAILLFKAESENIGSAPRQRPRNQIHTEIQM